MPDNRDGRDELADWLSEQVQPLPPPPGTFELIKRRARRRKLRKLAVTVASAAAVIAVAVAIPQVVSLHITGPPALSGNQAANRFSPTRQQSVPESNGSGAPAATPAPSPAGLGTGASKAIPPVPPNFAPESVTFIGLHTGWVIGQAGTPGHCATQYCTSIARTDDAGRSWSGVPAPLTGAPDGPTGVGGIRFLNAADGWAFGPELWATHDGGATWTRIPTNGQRVTDLETVGDRAFALFATCTGTGSDFAASCSSFTLYSAVASGDDWAPVGTATTGLAAGGNATSAALVLTGTRGFLIAPNGTLFAGPVDGSAPWQALPARAGGASCKPGQAQQNGQPSAEMLAAGTTSLALLCAQPSGDNLYLSTSGGLQPSGSPASGTSPSVSASASAAAQAWAAVSAPAAATATSLAEAPDGTVVEATGTGITVLPAGTTAWRQATLTGGAPSGGFSYVGMTADSQGIALPSDTARHEIWLTFDGGLTWQPSPIRS